MPTAPAQSTITEAQRTQFHDKGFMILENIVPDDMLTMMREECHYFVGYTDGQMDAKNETTQHITHRGKRYFIGNKYRMSHRLHRFLYADFMADVCRATLGDDAYLFNEQWVVKGPEQGMQFAWHQDSGYIKFNDKSTYHKPYLTCWIPLDDVTEENGTVYILPHDRAGTREHMIDHEQQKQTNDLVGYTGDDPGDPVICPAGSVVAFSSFTLHRSGANTSPNMRRVYLAQYSSERIVDSTNNKLWAQAVPFVKDGKNVYDKQKDFSRDNDWVAEHLPAY